MSLGSQIAPFLPELRRYGRLLSGGQEAGDTLVRATLEAIVEDPTSFPHDVTPRVGLYKVFDGTAGDVTFDSHGDVLDVGRRQSIAGAKRLERLSSKARKELLLSVVEGFSDVEIAYILGRPLHDASSINLSVAAEQMSSGEAAALRAVRPSIKIDFSETSIIPVDYAPRAEVREGRISLVEKIPNDTAVALELLNSLRLDHLNEAMRVRELGGNLGIGFQTRLSIVVKLLETPLHEASALRLSNQARGLALMRDAILEELTTLNGADVASFIDSLVLFCAQFPQWKRFEAALIQESPPSLDAQRAIEELSALIRNADPSAVDVNARNAVQEASNSTNLSNSLADQRYAGGLIHNIFSAVSRYLRDRRAGTAKRFNEALDEELGKAVASGVVNLVIAASTPLLALATQLPSQWAFAGPAIAAARIVLKPK